MIDTALSAVDDRLEAALYLSGVLAAVAAAYHAGDTGTWWPLLAVAAALTLAVLVLDSN